MVVLVNKSKSASSKTPSSANLALEAEKQRIQSREFTKDLITSFHRAKRRALAEKNQRDIRKT